tara:strand:+ start:1687 stop:2838 length:1152 start_codon:yes stop_codon:yes gene_type:complete
MTKHEKGQYFTTSPLLQDNVYSLILNEPSLILEPCAGHGHLVDYIKNKTPNVTFDLYEIDPTITKLSSVTENIIYTDFLKERIDRTYKTILGNPPYVRTSKGNLYLDFILKCYNLLEIGGELIFIVPSDFIKLTSSGNVINLMMENGTFTHIYHPHKENLFEDASIDVLIFRYCKDKQLPKNILVNNQQKYLINTNGILTYSDTHRHTNTMSDYFDIYVGIVSGRESILKNSSFGNIEVLNGNNKKDKYILINEFPTNNTELNNYMLNNKEELKSRKIRKFNDNNWFQWGALRNIEKMRNYKGKDCIYVHNITRNDKICFIDKVQYFGGGLLCMIPKNNIDMEDLKKFVNMINGTEFKKNYMYSNRFKIGHKQLSNALVSICI